MSIYQRPNSPFWYYQFKVAGVRFRGSTETTSKAEAKRVEVRKKAEALEARKAPADQAAEMSLNQAFDRYFEEVGQHCATADDIMRELGYLMDLGKDRLLSQITDSDVAAYIAKARGRRVLRFAGTGKKAKPSKKLVSPRTVNSQVQTLRAVFRRAAEVWHVNVGRMPVWRNHKLAEADQRSRELSVAEQEALFDHLRPDFRPMVAFALATGLRLANVIRLTWREVDLDAGVIVVKVKSKRHDGGRTHRLPITGEVREILLAEVGRHAEVVFTYTAQQRQNGHAAGDRVPFTQNGWRKYFRRALDEAGIEDFRFHDLRHTRATRVVRRSNLKVVQRLLGHADISSTARYAHAELDDIAAVMADDRPARKVA